MLKYVKIIIPQKKNVNEFVKIKKDRFNSFNWDF